MIASIRILLVALVASLGLTTSASAHPHVWVTITAGLIGAPDGAIAGVRYAWSFDDMYSAFAVQGIKQKTKGAFTRDELAPLAAVNIDSMKDYDYFTYATADGTKTPFAQPPTDYWLDYLDAVLTLHFTLLFKEPVKAKNLLIEIYDPTIYVDFEFAKINAVSAPGMSPQCKVKFERPPDMTLQAKKLSETFFNSQAGAQNWGAQFANKIMVECR
jgi:ABC-type uncharacterized transport system substrate-binding protein